MADKYSLSLIIWDIIHAFRTNSSCRCLTLFKVNGLKFKPYVWATGFLGLARWLILILWNYEIFFSLRPHYTLQCKGLYALIIYLIKNTIHQQYCEILLQ